MFFWNLLIVFVFFLLPYNVHATTAKSFLDGITPEGDIVGWAYDPDSSNLSIDVEFYIDDPKPAVTYGGGRYIGRVTANLASPDVNQVYGITGNHRYTFRIPPQLENSGYRKIYSYAIDPQDNISYISNNAPQAGGTAPVGTNIIRANAYGSEIVITTFMSLAGSVGALTFRNWPYIDKTDHGREMQTATTFNYGECFNPTEAGSAANGAGTNPSSSQLLSMSATGNVLESMTRMAFWVTPVSGAYCGGAKNTTIVSNDLVKKRIQIGYGGLANVIQHKVSIFVAPQQYANILSGYSRLTESYFEIVTGYMPSYFNRNYLYNPYNDTLGTSWVLGHPIILATSDSSHAMGIYAPFIPATGSNTAAYGIDYYNGAVTKWTVLHHQYNLQPGWYNYEVYEIVGTLDEVKLSMSSLYRLLNPTPMPTATNTPVPTTIPTPTSYPGDAYPDRWTNLYDLNVLIKMYGKMSNLGTQVGDFNLSGTTDLADFLFLRANFNKRYP